MGAVPPASVADWRYIIVPMLAGLATFWWNPIVRRWQNWVLVFDAAGLALFAVSGSMKASAFHLNPLAAMLLGVMTAVGGGVVRDVLMSEVPTVLHAELYAVAALGGAVIVVGGQLLQLPSLPVAIVGAVLCFGLRLLAIRRGWELPVARGSERPNRQQTEEDKEGAAAS